MVVDGEIQNDPKVTYAIEHAQELLNLLEEILCSEDDTLDGSLLFLVKSLSYKFFAHCTTILRIVQQDDAHIQFAEKSYVDEASVQTLVRVSVETYLILFEVFFEPFKDKDILEYRKLLWLLKGTAPGILLQEQILHLLDPETVEGYFDEVARRRHEHEEYKKVIKQNAHFRALTGSYRTQTESSLNNPNNYHRIKYSDRSRKQLFADAGLNEYLLTYLYSGTSSFVHSDGYSAWDSSPFNLQKNQGTSIGFLLFIPIALAGKIITHFASISETYKNICDQHSNTFKLANNLTKEMKKGRF